jgi:hypothetical protein
LILLCLLTACVDIPDRHPPELEAIRPRESAGFGRAGHVYCLLGWLGIWSHGMDVIAFFRGTRVNPDRAQTVVKNIDLRLIPVGFDASSITHFNIAQVTGVQDMVLAEIAKTCPLRYR